MATGVAATAASQSHALARTISYHERARIAAERQAEAADAVRAHACTRLLALACLAGFFVRDHKTGEADISSSLTSVTLCD